MHTNEPGFIVLGRCIFQQIYQMHDPRPGIKRFFERGFYSLLLENYSFAKN